MAVGSTPEAIGDLLGSVQVFASAVRDVLERDLLREATRGRITFPQLKLLKLIALTDVHTIGDVAAFLGVSNAAASKAVDKLVRRQLLRRTEGHVDRRESEISLSRDGRRLLDQYERAKSLKLAEIFGACGLEQLFSAVEMLDGLSARIVDHAAKPEEICLQCGIYFREYCLLRELVHRTCFYEARRARGTAGSRMKEPRWEGVSDRNSPS
ncbi:MAG: MarR family winged helix-turn-helix transcriptional regulator [Bryobacteraceae bacterium]